MRFASNLVVAVLGGRLVILSLTFAPATTRWLALGGGGAGVLVSLVAFATRGRGATLRWLAFSEATTLGALALVGLIADELATQRELAVAAEAVAVARQAHMPPGIAQPVRSRPDVAA